MDELVGAAPALKGKCPALQGCQSPPRPSGGPSWRHEGHCAGLTSRLPGPAVAADFRVWAPPSSVLAPPPLTSSSWPAGPFLEGVSVWRKRPDGRRCPQDHLWAPAQTCGPRVRQTEFTRASAPPSCARALPQRLLHPLVSQCDPPPGIMCLYGEQGAGDSSRQPCSHHHCPPAPGNTSRALCRASKAVTPP